MNSYNSKYFKEQPYHIQVWPCAMAEVSVHKPHTLAV